MGLWTVYGCCTAKAKKMGAEHDVEKWVNWESAGNDGENVEFVVLEA